MSAGTSAALRCFSWAQSKVRHPGAPTPMASLGWRQLPIRQRRRWSWGLLRISIASRSAATIVAASAILPLADDASQVARSVGTRHRAALGITQVRDALSIVVSEESGRVSIARENILTRGIKKDRFKGIVKSVFVGAPEEHSTKFSIPGWPHSWEES